MDKIQLDTAKDVAIEMLHYDMIEHENFGGLFVSHPFFTSRAIVDAEGIFDTKSEPERFSKFLKDREQYIRRLKSITPILLQITKPWKIEYIVELYESDIFSERDCGILLRGIWTTIENNELQEDYIIEYMESWLSEVPKRELMEEEDYDCYLSIPDEIKVYRGAQGKLGEDNIGFSWTTDYEIAKWFANRWGGDNSVCTMTISKSDIVFYTDERGEREIVLLPSAINPNKIEFVEQITFSLDFERFVA